MVADFCNNPSALIPCSSRDFVLSPISMFVMPAAIKLTNSRDVGTREE